jgi:DNA-binding CsgD family transcriptional regulator
MKRRRTVGHVKLSLTEREHTVLALIAEGLSNEAIAEHLSLSRHTVAWHIKQIFSKLGVNRRTQAVAVARSMGALGESGSVSQPHAILPAPLTPLLGRETELARLLDLLSPWHPPGNDSGAGWYRQRTTKLRHELRKRSLSYVVPLKAWSPPSTTRPSPRR